MRRRVGILLIYIIFTGIISIFAQPPQKHNWQLGTEISHIIYKEPGVMEEKGMMYGVVGSYTYHDKVMLKLEVKGSWGELDYSSPVSGVIENIPDYMVEVRGLGGYDFSVSEATILTPYIGIGYRYLNDDSSGKISSMGSYGYEREISYLYSPIGVEANADLKGGWSFGIGLEYDIFWDGTVKTHLSDVPGYLYDVENDQDIGYGGRISIGVQKKGESIDFLLALFVKYWNIKESNYVYHPVAGWVVEPKNSSTEYGVKFALKF